MHDLYLRPRLRGDRFSTLDDILFELLSSSHSRAFPTQALWVKDAEKKRPHLPPHTVFSRFNLDVQSRCQSKCQVIITMRLINTKTLKLIETFEHDIEPYAILSHTWGSEEVSFQEMQSGVLDTRKQGYRKIVNCCRQAVVDGYGFAWVDTCCMHSNSLVL